MKQAIRCGLISPDEGLGSRLATRLPDTRTIEYVRQIREYPDETGLRRMLLFSAPDIIFLDAKNVEAALRVATQLEAMEANVQLIAICDADAATLGRLMRTGIR